MKKLTTIISLVAMLAIGAVAESPNTRQIRDAVRSLNSKLDDIEQSFRSQMQSNSVARDQIDILGDDIKDLRGTVADLDNNLDRHRDNREDGRRVVESAQRLNDVILDVASNKGMERDWQTARDQVDRIAHEYGIVARWDEGSGTSNSGYSNNSGSSNGNYSDNDPAPKARPQIRPMPPTPVAPDGNVVSVGLSGTYTLDKQASENIDDIVRNANVAADQQSDLRDKLEAPDQVALDIRGQQVTLATSKGDPVTFTADGRDKSQDVNGRTVRLRATLSGDTLVVSSIGGETDFNITFTSISGGRGLKVSRRITTDYLSQTVFAESLYNKTDATARLDIGGGQPVVASNNNDPGTSTTTNSNAGGSNNSNDNRGYSDNDQNGTISNGGGNNNGGYNNGGYNNGGNNRRGNNRGSGNNNSNNGGWGNNNPNNNNGGYNGAPRITNRSGNFVVPNGVTINARLEGTVDTTVSQNNDRFRMTVDGPAEYRGAVIEGYITGVTRSGKISGQSGLTFNFETITMADGKRYDFAGQLMSLNDASGKVINVDNEGMARGDNQTKETAKRGAMGGGLGALIGVIAGGGKGAAIGAIIGAGGGASTVLITGKEDVKLQPGSTATIQSTSPANIQR